MSEAPRISVTPITVGFFLSVIAALTIGWNVVSYFKDIEQKNIEQDIRLNRTDEDRQVQKEMSGRMATLNDSVIKLTEAINVNAVTRRADNSHLDGFYTPKSMQEAKR